MHYIHTYIHAYRVISNTVVLASERCLDAQHPIRRLLKPHTYGSAHVNLMGAVTLAPYGGIASRLFGQFLLSVCYVRMYVCMYVCNMCTVCMYVFICIYAFLFNFRYIIRISYVTFFVWHVYVS